MAGVPKYGSPKFRWTKSRMTSHSSKKSSDSQRLCQAVKPTEYTVNLCKSHEFPIQLSENPRKNHVKFIPLLVHLLGRQLHERIPRTAIDLGVSETWLEHPMNNRDLMGFTRGKSWFNVFFNGLLAIYFPMFHWGLKFASIDSIDWSLACKWNLFIWILVLNIFHTTVHNGEIIYEYLWQKAMP